MDGWSPGQYDRFAQQREEPFWELAGLVRPRAGMRLVDLGCGAGRLTRALAERLGATSALGVDSSAAMLEQAAPFAGDGVSFVRADAATWEPSERVDLVFSNAALHWVPGHERLLQRMRSWLRPGGQLAIQMPQNDDHPSHRTARALVRDHEFKWELGHLELSSPLLPLPAYAAWLHRLGFAQQRVYLRVHPVLLESREQVPEWVAGALLSQVRARLKPERFARFLERYRALLVPQLADEQPFLYPYPRVYVWGQLAE